MNAAPEPDERVARRSRPRPGQSGADPSTRHGGHASEHGETRQGGPVRLAARHPISTRSPRRTSEQLRSALSSWGSGRPSGYARCSCGQGGSHRASRAPDRGAVSRAYGSPANDTAITEVPSGKSTTPMDMLFVDWPPCLPTAADGDQVLAVIFSPVAAAGSNDLTATLPRMPIRERLLQDDHSAPLQSRGVVSSAPNVRGRTPWRRSVMRCWPVRCG